MPDSHRLNFHYIHSAERLLAPTVNGSTATWPSAIQAAVSKLQSAGGPIAMIASARMTLEEMFLARRLAAALGITQFDVLPRAQKGDGFLVSDDGNPNTAGAKLHGLATGQLPEIAAGVASGSIKGLLVLGEDATDCGISADDLGKLSALVTMGILSDKTTAKASVVLSSASFAEKRGSMINVKNRIQRLNKAIEHPGQARDDWEILRDLIQAAGGSNGIYTIEEVFKQMASETPALSGLSLSGLETSESSFPSKP